MEVLVAIKATKQAVLVEGEFDCLVWWSWALGRGKAINWIAWAAPRNLHR